MKIDFVTDTFPPDVNGAAMTLGRLASGLGERGHRVHVIRSGEAAAHGQTSMSSLALPGYKEVRIGMPGPFRLRKRWVKRRPDVVYIATESPLGHSAAKAAGALGIPVVSGFHTNFHQYMEPYRLAGLQASAMAYLLKLHGRADGTVAPSAEVVEMLRREGLENVHLLGRGVDGGMFSPAKRDISLRAAWGTDDGSPVFLAVGRLAAEKNLDLAVRAFRRVRVRNPGARFVMVGDGPLRARLEAENPFIHFTGVCLGEDLARHYASADVLLFPSETETFGNVLLEAMASGLVTVSYDYAASARHVRHGKNGLKTEKGNMERFMELAEESSGMAKDMTLRTEARDTALAHGWPEVTGRFEEILSGVAWARSAPGHGRAGRARPGKFDCRTVFLSDIHLGTADSKAREVTSFLKRIRCQKLVLNGDIIDGWALRRGSRWRNHHSRVIRVILKKMEKEGTEVVYLRGNHDDIIGRFLPLTFGALTILDEHIHSGPDGKRYLVIHGDGFDSVSTRHKWLAVIGSVGYDWLLGLNRIYNHWRAWRGKEYYSVSKAIKARVKSAVSFVGKYEEQLQKLARRKKCDGIICGHIHTPEDKQVGEIHYLNSGDWVESLTAIVEHEDGRMELVRYNEFMERVTRSSEIDGVLALGAQEAAEARNAEVA
jgi:UDP-2,3-diacylglucosamine pyrophosphatase LpxH/glycosyltransferase involved in cell wall biosynthesis